ncbi:AmmeMemoRadiSam system protein A [Desulfovibrio subterraneus]|uniref:AmmeMemoRadiSam system protein A n=1 Tax=Desulfovibrio subterraneus TaxID=2718620 RepID=A0A7J0BGT8_9BACT|nr:AmmeMemoRadiSam system protein A [Desulfovibrio subterraneus]GFM32768.1 AmmeMemoRadiSam system protein A [Desulfovibrio subterraneus]
MVNKFRLELTEDEKSYLLALVRQSIRHSFGDVSGDAESVASVPSSATLNMPLGAFVTLKKQGMLRGCIGSVVSDIPLHETIARMAQAAAFEDPRFPPLIAGELAELEVDISVLGPVTPCDDVRKIEVGRHGLIVRRGMQSGLLLPQVPVEWGWDRDTFLAQTCRKAGLAEDAWKQEGTQILWFEAVVF